MSIPLSFLDHFLMSLNWSLPRLLLFVLFSACYFVSSMVFSSLMLVFLFIIFKDVLFLIMHMCEYVCASQSRDVGLPGVGVTGGCES